MDVITDELCMMAVNIAPMRTRSIGLLIAARKVLTPSRDAKSDMELLIRDRPTKSIPSPDRIPPHVCPVLLFEKSAMKAPTPAKAENTMVVERELLPPNIPRATICAVMVVPILAPYIMVAACESEIIPALTKPIVMTVVAPELCIAAVPNVPMPTPSNLLFEALANSFLSLSELADSRLVLII